MKKLLLSLLIALSCCLCAMAQELVTAISIPSQEQGTKRVYAELVGSATNLLGKNENVKVQLDCGQYQSTWKRYDLQDENGKEIKFNSMVAAMNYMGDRGWKFVQVYVISLGPNSHIYHWLMYKDILPEQDLMEGLNVKNAD